MAVREALLEIRGEVGRIFPDEFFETVPYVFDFSSANTELKKLGIFKISPESMPALERYIRKKMDENSALIGMGRYGEHRIGYDTELFTGKNEPRVVHLGIDLFVPAGTNVLAPINGRVHSLQVNSRSLDYGPTIILEHEVKGVRFYTLYGHLSTNSLDGLRAGKSIRKGERFAFVGDSSVNGGWVPHVHFELIADMMGRKGDFPGMASLSEKEKYLALCINPNLLLNSEVLD